RSVLNTNATFGVTKSVDDIGEGNGFASRCGMVTCAWTGDEAADNLPSRVVVKIPSVIPFRKLNDSLPKNQRMIDGDEAMWKMIEGQLREVHDIEVATYDFFDNFEGLS
ncbi:hypothetical protein PFISCL1PPCAC_23166, partial [Pristionchus fissidentatus]